MTGEFLVQVTCRLIVLGFCGLSLAPMAMAPVAGVRNLNLAWGCFGSSSR